jgi:hypothetical protein
MKDLLTPQPKPQKKGLIVYNHLRTDLTDCQFSYELIKLVEQRYYFGIEKHGQPLMTDDGRDTVSDAVQEAIDVLYYIEKGILQGKDWHYALMQAGIVVEMLMSTVDKGE